MAIIYSYPKVTSPLATDVLVLTDTTLTAGKRKNKTKSLAMSDLAAYVVSSTSGITGGGTFNTIPLWTPDGLKLGDSIITQAGQSVTVTGRLDVTTDFSVAGAAELYDTLTVDGTLTADGVATFNDDLNVTGSTNINGALEVQGVSAFNDDALFFNQVDFESSVSFQGTILDQNGDPGTPGQVLSSTGADIQWINNGGGGGGTVTGTGTTNNLPLWLDGPNGDIGDSQLRQLGPNASGVYQLRFENADRFIINKPSGVTSGDPEYLITQDGNFKVSMGWDDDGAGYGYLYNWAGDGWRFGSAGNNPELTIVTTAGSEGVTIANDLFIDGTTTTAGDLYIERGLKDGDNSYGTAGQVLSTTGIGQNVEWIDSSTSALTAESIVQPIIADGALLKGDPVYITGFNNGQNKNIVAKADSSDPAKMPVVGISDGAYANNDAGFMTAFGSFNGTFDTTGGAENWDVGDIIYVKPGGGLTNIKPGGTDLIQNIAIVSRVQQNTGELEVIALGRANDVPNPLVVNNALQRLGIRGNPERELDVFGGVRVRGTLDLFQGNDNTFAGTDAGNLFNIVGSANTGFGENTQAAQSTGQSNASLGFDSLKASVTGNNNTAIGTGSMESSNGGSFNTALGSASLSTATLGQGNTAIGFSALADKTTTNFNTAVGNNCLGNLTTGFRNTAVGNDAGKFISDGITSNLTGNQSIFIGDSAKALANAQNNQIVIGYDAIGNGANTATIGNTATTALHVGGDNAGIVLKSPNGTAYTIRVTDAGALVVT